MRARRTGPAVVSGQTNDIRIRFGNTHSNDADAGNDWDFYSNPGFGIDGLELFDELREVFNRINIVIIGRRDQIHAGAGMPRCRHFLCDLARGQVTALTRLCALTNFDLNQVCGVDGFSRDTKTT